MLVYLVGCISKPGDRKYYFGYTDDIHIADEYHNMLVEKDDTPYNSKYKTEYFIESMPFEQFNELDAEYAKTGHGIIERLDRMEPNGPIMTDSDMEMYTSIVGEHYSNICVEIDHMKELVDSIREYAKIDKRKDFKKVVKAFGKLFDIIDKDYFSDPEAAYDHIDWVKVQRKN